MRRATIRDKNQGQRSRGREASCYLATHSTQLEAAVLIHAMSLVRRARQARARRVLIEDTARHATNAAEGPGTKWTHGRMDAIATAAKRTKSALLRRVAAMLLVVGLLLLLLEVMRVVLLMSTLHVLMVLSLMLRLLQVKR